MTDEQTYYLELSMSFADADALVASLKIACDLLKESQGVDNPHYIKLTKFYNGVHEDVDFFKED